MKMMLPRFAAHCSSCLVGLAFLLLLSACASTTEKHFKGDSDANVYVDKYASNIEKVAIMPFKAPTELIGSSVSDLFVTEMLRAGRYTLVERGQMAKVLSESELAMAGLSAGDAMEVGQMLGADAVIIGTVSEYGTVAHRGHPYPTVGISARLIDSANGKVIWSVDLAERADSKKTTLSGHARDIVHGMCSALYQQWGKQKRVKKRRSSSTASSTSRSRTREARVSEPVSSGRKTVSASVAPEKPRGFSVSQNGLREVAMTWESPVDSPDRYQVERCDTPDGIFVPVDDVSPRRKKFTDEGFSEEPLQDSTDYYYRLVALSSTGERSEPTPVLKSTTAPPPATPEGLHVEASSSRAATLQWTASSGEGVTEYIVERAMASEPDDFQKIAEVSTTSYLDGGTRQSELEDSTEYLYRVYAVNRVGSEGEATDPVLLKSLPPPAPPQSLEAASEHVRCVPLTWQESPEEDVIQYHVYRAESRDGEYRKIGAVERRTNPKFLDGGSDPGILEDNTDYYYYVVAENNVGAFSDASDVRSATTRNVPPIVLGVTAASMHAREVPVFWEATRDEKVVGYEVWRAEGDDGEFVEIADVRGHESSEYLDRGIPQARKKKDRGGLGQLRDQAKYRYKILAYNTADAHSEWSAEAEAITRQRPSAPSGLGTTDSIRETVELAWSANPETNIARYVVESSPSRSKKFRSLAERSADEELGVTHENLDHGSKHYYRVQAFDVDGLKSDWSELVEGRAKPLPDAPANLEVTYEEGTAQLSWEEPSQNDITSYTIWKKSFLSWEKAHETEYALFTLESEDIGKSATFCVTAVDEDGLESERSTDLKVMPPVARNE